MAASWAARAHSNPQWQRPEEQKAITTIQNLLESHISPETAAEMIGSAYEARAKQGEAHIYYLWAAVCDAINHLGGDTKNLKLLVHMLRSISSLPDIVGDEGQAIKSDVNAQIFWRDMPGFAFDFRGEAMDVAYTEDIDTGRVNITWADQIKKITNGNTFAALYLRELDPEGPQRDLLSIKNHACWTLYEALEVATDTPKRIRRTEMYIPAAAPWILITGRNIWQFSKRNDGATGENVTQRWIGGDDGGELLWAGSEGFSLERWGFWKKRFGEISGIEAKEHVQQLAARAVEEMEKIEREMAE